MRTTLNLDDEIMRIVPKETGAETKTEAVHEVLKDFVRRKKMKMLIQMHGKVRFSSDWKTLRGDWERNSRGSR
jgi:Arc/MetJ family transcription regulator